MMRGPLTRRARSVLRRIWGMEGEKSMGVVLDGGGDVGARWLESRFVGRSCYQVSSGEGLFCRGQFLSLVENAIEISNNADEQGDAAYQDRQPEQILHNKC